MNDTKICIKCGKEHPISFYRKSEKWRQNVCIDCNREDGRKRYYKRHEHNKEISRNYAKTRNTEKRHWDRLGCKFNLKNSKDWYTNQLKEQNGGCAICSSKVVSNKSHRYFYADHNHETGQLRGLLCLRCNSMIGFAKDDVRRLKSAILYLEKYNLT